MKKQFPSGAGSSPCDGQLVAAGADRHRRQTATATRKKADRKAARKHVETKQEQAIRELQEKMAAQQAQIDALMQQNASEGCGSLRRAAIGCNGPDPAAAAQSQAQAATAAEQQQAQQVDTLEEHSHGPADDERRAGHNDQHDQDGAEREDRVADGDALQGRNDYSGGFFAFEDVWRERSVNSDINTPFNTIPLPSANEGHASELNFSGRQSRLGALFTGNAGHVQAHRLLREGLPGHGHDLQ